MDLERATEDLRIGLGQQDDDGEFRLWAVETAAGSHVGIVSWMADWRYPGVYELSELLVAPQERGQGFGTEISALVLATIFESRPARKVMATAAANNDAVARTIVRSGGTREATLRRHLLVGDEEVDVHVYGLLRDDYTGKTCG